MNTQTIAYPDAQRFEKTIDGKKVSLFHLQNKNNTQVYLTNYGARIVSFIFKDSRNNPVDVNLGKTGIDEYTEPQGNYYGCVIGRVCNRIAGAEFDLNGKHTRINKTS